MLRKTVAVLALLLGPHVCGAAELHVVAATNDLGAIADAVGGERVRIEVVARPNRDPHFVEVRPSTMRKTAKADIYLSVGMDLDQWSEDIVRGSRNRNLIVVDCSQAIEAVEVPHGKVDASMGDVHPEGNPHYWLDPLNGIAIAQFLAQEFTRAQPEGREAFESNAAAFTQRIEERFPEWHRRLEGVSFVEYHRSWVYMASRFSMHIAGQVEPLPGIPPTAKHLAKLSELIEEVGAQVVIRDPYHNNSPTDFLRRETGIQSRVVPTMCETPTAASYVQHFDDIADALGRPSRAATTPKDDE